LFGFRPVAPLFFDPPESGSLLPMPHLPRHLIHSTLAVLGLTLLAKFSGAFKEVVMASSLGTGDLADQFVFAFIVATWPVSILTSVLTTALVPVLSKRLAAHRTGGTDEGSFLAQLWCAGLLFATLLATLLWLCFPYLSPLARAGGPKFAHMVGVVAFLSCLTTLAGTVLTSMGRQIGALLEGLPSLALGVLLLAPWWSQADSLIYGLVLGTVLQLLWLMSAQARALGAPRLLWPQRSAAWEEFFAGLGYVTAGYVLLLSAAIFGIYIASYMDPGSVASFSYASRITALAMGLLMAAVNRVTIVHFCNQGTALGSTWRAWAGVCGGFALVAASVSLVLLVLAPQIVALLFERGQFEAEQTATVAHLVRWNIGQMVPGVACAVLTAYLAAAGLFRSAFIGCLLCFLSESACVLMGLAGVWMQSPQHPWWAAW
jgi:putative peptidoglycan lipid II flippase